MAFPLWCPLKGHVTVLLNLNKKKYPTECETDPRKHSGSVSQAAGYIECTFSFWPLFYFYFFTHFSLSFCNRQPKDTHA